MRSIWRIVRYAAAGLLVCGQASRADEAELVFESLYGGEYRKVLSTRDKADDVALAKQLVEATRTATGQPKLFALLCRKAYLLAAKDPEGHETAIEAMKLLARNDPAEKDDCRAKVLDLYQARYNTSRREERPAAGQALVQYLMGLGDEDSEQGDYASAVRQLRRASYVARTACPSMSDDIAESLKQAVALERTARDIERAKGLLKTNPGNSAARSQLVRLYVVEKDAPAEAAKFLDAGSPEPMKTCVPLAVKDPASLPDATCLELAEWYRSLSANASAAAKPAMLRRAKGYYETFLSKHAAADMSRTKAELALKKVDQTLTQSAPTPAGGTPTVRLPPRAGKASGPFGAMALVSRPGAVAGGRPWTIELSRPRGRLEAVAFSRDGRHVAMAGRSGVIRICEAATGKLVQLFLGHDAGIHALAYSPDGDMLASASGDKTIRIWNAQTGKALQVLKGHKAAVTSLSWSPNGTVLASGSQDETAGTWYVRSGRLTGLLTEHKHGVEAVAWAPNGKYLASAAGSKVHIWDAKGYRRDMVERGSTICALAWSPDSKYLAFGGRHRHDEAVFIWYAALRKLVQELKNDVDQTSALAWSPDGKKLAAEGTKGSIVVWETGSWQTALTVAFMRDSGGDEGVADLAWSPDGKLLAACGNQHPDHGVVKAGLWNASTGHNVWLVESHIPRITAMAYSSDGRNLAYCCRQWNKRPILRVCDARSGQTHGQWEVPEGESRAMAWSPDGQTLAGGFGETFALWDANADSPRQKARGQGREVEGVAWSPDGKSVAACNMTASPRVFEAASGKLLKQLEDKQGATRDLAWSPNGRWLAAATCDNGHRVYLWDLSSDRIPDVMVGHEGGVNAAAWSPDSRMLATGSSDKTVRIWGVHPCRPLKTLEGHEFEVRVTAWSPDGRTLASGEAPRRESPEIRLWDARRWQPLATLGGHTRDLVDLAWSADGGTLASACQKMIRLWDVKSRLPALTLLPIGELGHIAVGCDGHFRAPKEIDVERDIVYVTQTPNGPELLAPSAFAAKCAWKNDPAKVAPQPAR